MTAASSHIPHLDAVLHRPRLFQRMAQSCRIVLVTGQAAQGKTTLVADFLSTQDLPTQWVHLNRAASDHGVLFDLLYRGLERLKGRHVSGREPNPPHITLGSRKDLLRYSEILITAMAHLVRVTPPHSDDASHTLNLVLDDLETLDPEGSAFALIDALLKDAPDTVRFFLLSRTTPPLSLSRYRMKKQLMTIGNQDLAFTRQETLDFFSPPDDDTVPPLSTNDIDKILCATEGWIGGLVLVSESLRTGPDLGDLPDQLSSDAFSYFSDEIYRSLSPDLRQFLMETSLFPELDTRILSQFFENKDVCDVLTQLERRNLFVSKVSAHPQWPVFRYNNLFKEFLASDLKMAMAPSQLVELNLKAGEIYWENRDHDTAIEFFLAAGAHDKIAQIIRIKGTDDLISGRGERLLAWIRALPSQISDTDPWLILFSTAARRIKGGKANIKAFRQALDLFQRQSDVRGILLCLAYLIEAAVFIRQPSTVILKWIKAGETQLAALKGKQRYTWARTMLWQQIGLGYIAGNGDIPKGISACRNAILLARGIDNPDLLLNASIILTLGFVQSGDFTSARDMLDKLSEVTGEERFPEYRALNNITNIDFALKRGDLDLAGQLLESAEADIEKFGLIFLYPGFVEAKAIYLAARGLYDQALQTADHLSDFSILEGNTFYMGVAHRIRAVTWLFQGHYTKAQQEAVKAVDVLGQLMRGDIHLNLARQILAISLFHNGNYTGAKSLLAQVFTYFKGIGSDLSLCETAFVLGLAAVENGEDGKMWFTQGIERALENGYRNFPFAGPGLLGQALVWAAASGVMPGDLEAYYNRAETKDLCHGVRRGIAACLSKTPKSRQTIVAGRLASLYKAALPQVRINTLGSFQVTLDGDVLDPSLFGGAKPLLLLKTILLKGGQGIPKDVLIDALWPKAAPAAGEKNFKINLHRLRKALEPEPVKAFGYVYISQKSGRVSLDPDLVTLDTQTFMDALNRGMRLEANGHKAKAIEAYTHAWQVYGGDYFSDDLYLEWVGHQREFFRHKCIEMLEKKATLHRSSDQWQDAVDTWQSLLTLDSCHERAFRHLMTLYGEAGMKGDVVRIFDQCRTSLKADLDVDPDDETLAVFERTMTALH